MQARRGGGGEGGRPEPLRVQRAAARHDRAEPQTLSGFLRLRYRSDSPLHVGTGSLVLWDEGESGAPAANAARGAAAAPRRGPVREAVRIEGRPGIPGSTLRGALRRRHARLTHSCPGGRPRFDGPQNPAEQPCRGREVCPGCALFGMPGLASRLRVSDALAPDGTAFALAALPGGRPRPPRAERGGRPGALPPRAPALQWAEVIPAGTPLELALGVRNLRPEELGALLGALGCEPQSAFVCGARGRSGLGRLFLEGLEIDLYGADGTAVQADVGSWRAAFERSRDRAPEGEAALLRELERVH